MINKNKQNLAIRFGLGAIKAVGLAAMETAVTEREKNGKFKDVYDFCTRMDPKNINKKSIEALAKSGSFDKLFNSSVNSRRQIFESFDILSRFANEQNDQDQRSQLNLFNLGLNEEEMKPELKKVKEWSKEEKLQKEFEAFGFFLNEHPIDEFVEDLKKRGIIFSKRLEGQDLEDNNLIKMAGIVASSKHRSGFKGRFAYLTMSDPFGIYEILIFDEELITKARDLIIDGSMIAVECTVKKDDGGTRILAREVFKLTDFIKDTKARTENFEDIKKQAQRSHYKKNNFESDRGYNSQAQKELKQENFQRKVNELKNKKIYSKIEIIIKERNPIFDIKAFLSGRVISEELKPQFLKITKVIFCVISDKNIFRIALPNSYLIDDSDISKLRLIEKVIDVEANM
jgi:DNA polymerase III alpha subunit